MVRYSLAAAAALIALAAAPAAAKQDPAASAPACPVPAIAYAPMLSESPDSVLEDKIDQLTDIIADLSDRLASLEDAIGAPDDEGYGDTADGLDLIQARDSHQPVADHRRSAILRAERPLPPRKKLAPRATSIRKFTRAGAIAKTSA